MADVWPRRLPALYAGQPLRLTGRVLRQGTEPVVVHGRLGDQGYTMRVTPTAAPDGRAIPSTWARDAIDNLQRDLLWGEDEDLVEQIRTISLSYQVLSPYTAFVAVDRSRVVRRSASGAPPPEGEQAASRAQRGAEEDTIELCVVSRAPAVDTESTSVGQLLTKDFLQRVPAGRSYQGLVVGANPTLAGGATNENSYLLDGVNVTDPVSGTFALNIGLDALQQIELDDSAVLPDHPGAGPAAELVTRTGTNTLELRAHAEHLWRPADGPPLAADRLSASLAGPLVHDHVWALANYGYDRLGLDGAAFRGHTAFAKVTAQPTVEHRLTASALGNLADSDATDQLGGLATARWQWFPSPEVNTDASAALQHVAVGGEVRDRAQAQVRVDAPYVRFAGP
ncbi:MAG: hypothetical protein R3F59_30675 [Myxococcota bacterium]